MKTYQLYINGKWQDAVNGELKNVYSPTNEDLIAKIQDGDEADAIKALKAAESAHGEWSLLPARKRAEILRRFVSLIRNKRADLANLLVKEQGKLHRVAEMEVDVTCSFIEYACDWARHLEGNIIPSDNKNEHIYIHKVSRGVVVAITAWNFSTCSCCS